MAVSGNKNAASVGSTGGLSKKALQEAAKRKLAQTEKMGNKEKQGVINVTPKGVRPASEAYDYTTKDEFKQLKPKRPRELFVEEWAKKRKGGKIA